MMTLGSRFEALRAHTNLVVTISEEKQLFEENLKLVMLRVNSATSLLKWAREEGNPYLRSMVEKLYSITLMSATVQRQYAEQCCGFSKSLESILKVEQGLDAIRKQRNLSKEKMDNLQKQIDACKRKSDLFKIKQLQDELSKHTLDEEELAAELQVKFVKAEIFKMKVLKTAFEELTNAYSENAAKVKTICAASNTVIADHPDVPTFLGIDEEPKEEESPEYRNAMSALAADLGLSEKFSSPGISPPLAKIKSTLASDAPAKPRMESRVNQEGAKANNEEKSSDVKSPVETRNSPESKVRKRLSKLPGALAANFHRPKLKVIKEKGKRPVGNDDDTDNFVIIQPVAKEAPSVRPPALLLEPRRRSKSSIEIGTFKHNYDRKNPAGIPIDKRRNHDDRNDISDDDDYECPSYILPNSYNDEGSHLVRWTSDNALSKGTLPAYEEPADAYGYLWHEKSDSQDTSEPIYDSPYDLPFDSLGQDQDVPAPKKPLPEAPEITAPPKPKRNDPNEALYINTSDVEKLLTEIYQEPQLTKEVKPEIQKKALKKIRQEQLQTSRLALDLQDSVIDLTPGITNEEETRENAHSEPGYVNFFRPRSPCKSGESGEQAPPPPQQKRVQPKQPPKVPARPQNKPEAHARENPSPLPHEASPSGAIPLHAKKSDDKVSKPKVPPRPVNLP